MIGEVSALVVGVFENPAVATLVGFLPDVADKIGNARYHFVKSRNLDALVREYAYIAEAMGCPTLARLLRTRGVIDELDASCDGSMSKRSLAEQMLSNASIPEAECAAEKLCQQFVGDYFVAKNWIDDERLEAATALNGERITSGLETVGDELSQLRRDISEHDNNTALILDQMIAGNLTYEQAREHVRHHGRDDRSSRLMGLYCDVLSGDGLDESDLSEAGAFPDYEAFLAGCMASAWRLDDLARLASVAGRDLREDIERILPVLRGEEPLASVCKGNVLEGFHDDDLAMLCLAEFAYFAGAFDVASWHFAQCSKPYGEAAELHHKASELLVALVNCHVVPDDVKALVETIPGGMAPSVTERAIDAGNLGMALLTPEDFEAIYSDIDDCRKKLCERASSWHRLDACDAEEAWSILRTAESRGFIDVFLGASDRLIADPAEAAKVRRHWKGRTNMLCDHYALLEFYLSRVDPEISSEHAADLVADKLGDPVYELALAEHFADRDEGFYKTCVERAIGAMSDGARGAIDTAHTHVWVPYLVEHGREREILAILAPVGALPERVAADMVSLLWRNGADQEVIDELIDRHAVWRQASQPRTLHVLAAYCFGAGDYAAAVALGTRSFDGQTTVQTAQLVANAGNLAQQQVPRRIVKKLIDDDGAMSLFLAAGQRRIAGEDDQADNLLVRAVLLGGEGSAQSAAALAGEWAGGPIEGPAPSVIGKNCAVAYVAEDGTKGFIVFHEPRRRVPNERRKIGDTLHLTVGSPEFAHLEGKGLGSTHCRRLGNIDVVGIETAESYILRLCFEMMTGLPDVDVLTLGDDPVSAIGSYLKSHKEATRARTELVQNGVRLEGGPTIYPGISTASALLGQSHLEFAFRVSRDPRTPLRRAPESQIEPNDKARFLLSASALTMIAVACLGQECEELILGAGVVTETTRNLLAREAEIFRSQIDRSAGMLFLGTDGKPILVPMSEEERRARRAFVANVIDVLDSVQLLKVDAARSFDNRTPRRKYVEIGTCESQDWIACEHEGLTYVTEDAMEAVRIAAGDEMEWCSLLQMLGMLGMGDYELSRCSVGMHRAGCEPSMGRSQALLACSLLMERRSLDEEARATLLNYVEATGFLDHADVDGQRDQAANKQERKAP